MAWPKIAEIIAGANAHVAGGYVSWHMSNRFNWNHLDMAYELNEVVYYPEFGAPLQSNRPTDLDIFTYTPEGFDKVEHSLMRKGFKPLVDTKYSSTWEDGKDFLGVDNYSHLRHGLSTGFSTGLSQRTSPVDPANYPKLPINVIKPLFGDSLVKVLDHFDFYLVKFALLDGNTAITHAKAIEQVDSKSLISSCPNQILERPFYTLGRYMKYIQKGYKVNYMDLLRLVITAQAHGIDEADVKMDEVHKLVKHFGQYLNDGENLGQGEDFRPTFNDAYGEWLRYIREKKLN